MRPQKPLGLPTPGLSYRERKTYMTLYWIAQTDIVKRGYPLTSVRLWPSPEDPNPTEPSADEWTWIASECGRLQSEMSLWANGAVIDDPRSRFDGTLGALIEIYLTDRDSSYQELRHNIKVQYAQRLAVVKRLCGGFRLSALTFRDFKRWHEEFGADRNKHAYAHALMTNVRLVMGFGKLLRLGNAAQLADELSNMRFQGPKKRKEFMTAAWVNAFREVAHREGRPSMALAMVLQFELMLRQKDVIGEWLPVGEPGVSDVTDGHRKWLHGVHWRDIDTNLILRKRISKSLRGRRAVLNPDAGNIEEYDLNAYPMVMEELGARKDSLHGPLIVCEYTARPWRESAFHHEWRRLADLAGIPKTVQSRDSRAGGITEGRKAGASLEDLRHHASHSQTTMTARYDRGNVEDKNKVAHLRIKSRTP